MKYMKYILVACILFTAPAAWALTVSPMGVHINPLSGSSYTTVTAINNSSRPVVIESFAERRETDVQGNLKLVSADADFVIFPPVVNIKPGASQAFRLQWVGDVKPDDTKKYYVTISQLPISAEEIDSQLQPTGDDAKLTVRLGYAFRVAVTVGKMLQ